MPRASNRLLLMLALGLPGTTLALGLGDLHVQSALNEPLSAQIEIASATPEELATLVAQLADRQTYLRYHTERPSYLATIRITAGSDGHGHPVLAVHSTAPCTDPMVELLVDIRWPNGELIRDYSVLLDPVGYMQPAQLAPVVANPAAPAAAVAEAAAVTAPALPGAQPAPVREPTPAIVAPAATAARPDAPVAAEAQANRTGSAYVVRAHDTLYGIVRRAGAATEAEAQRMMIAVFRANPAAFDRNINILHRGAVLSMPAMDQLAALDATEARRSVAEQMRAWRLSGGASALPPDMPRPIQPDVTEAMDRRVHLLEEALAAQQQQLQRIDGAIHDLTQPLAVIPAQVAPAQVAPVQVAPATAAPARAAVTARDAARPASSRPRGASLALGVALSLTLAIMLVLAVRAMRRRPAHDARAAQDPQPVVPQPEEPTRTAGITMVDPGTVVQGTAEVETVRLPAHDRMPEPEDTVEHEVPVATGAEPADAGTVRIRRAADTAIDYNLADLDATAQFVYMPSELNDKPAFVERRMNVLEVLRSAIRAAPYRRDLRMKLLETCYGMAAGNLRSFQEYVQEQASDPETLSPEEWQKVGMMCEALGLKLDLPNQKAGEKDDLADCA